MFPTRQQLNNTQQTALSLFQKSGHLIIYGPRQSGKTATLQWLVATRPSTYKIALVGLHAMNHGFIHKLKEAEERLGCLNSHCITPLTLQQFGEMYLEPDRPRLRPFNLVIFDGGILFAHEEFETASAYCDGECLAQFGKASTIKFSPLKKQEDQDEHG